MEIKKLNDDAFMIKLLGDIYTASNSLSPAFIGSRLTSQGLQRAYQVNYTPDMFDFEDHLFRSTSLPTIITMVLCAQKDIINSSAT